MLVFDGEHLKVLSSTSLDACAVLVGLLGKMTVMLTTIGKKRQQLRRPYA